MDSGVSPSAPLLDLVRALALPPADDLAAFMLAGADARGRAASILNNDGNPLQLCLSAGPSGFGARLIADPAAHLPGGAGRHRIATNLLPQFLERCQAQSLAEPMARSLDLALAGPPDRYRDGTLWLAAGLGRPGAALYLDARHPTEDAWTVAARWLAGVLPDATVAQAAIAALRADMVPASFAIEGRGWADGRAKLYFRQRRAKPLAQWGVPLFGQPALSDFLAVAAGDQPLADGLVASLGFSLADGSPADAKIDLCGHCLALSPRRWQALERGLAARFGHVSLPLARILAGGEIGVAFIGLGVDRGGGTRFNLYLQQATADPGQLRRETVAALEDGVAALAARQEGGRFCDYHLPVGRSDQWVTAYAGHALADAAPLAAAARAPAEQACDWLERNRTYAAGWGFNHVAGADADSTAFALALRRRLGRPVEGRDQDFLLGHWQPGGGIATFASGQAWGEAHACVTPLAYLGLTDDDRARLRPELLDWLHRTRLANGLWPAYWWRHSLYATHAVLELLEALGVPESAFAPPRQVDDIAIDNSFDLAWVLGIESRRGASTASLRQPLRQLLALQQPDGSWPGAANLRVTDPDCRQPWIDPKGALYADGEGIITTASVLRALSRLAR